MKTFEKTLQILGIDSKLEISNLLNNDNYPEYYNPINDFEKSVKNRSELIKLLKRKNFLEQDNSNFNVLEIGGGICSTGAAFAEEYNSVISFELEKIHCLYAKRCKEHFDIENLGVLYGSISKIEESQLFKINDNSVDLVISHMGMFKDTILSTLTTISKLLKSDGKLILIYPRFWTNSNNLNEVDIRLLERTYEKTSDCNIFYNDLLGKLEEDFIIKYSDILEEYNSIPIGGDVILGSQICSNKEEYFDNPIEGITFGKTLITINTILCVKK